MLRILNNYDFKYSLDLYCYLLIFIDLKMKNSYCTYSHNELKKVLKLVN